MSNSFSGFHRLVVFWFVLGPRVAISFSSYRVASQVAPRQHTVCFATTKDVNVHDIAFELPYEKDVLGTRKWLRPFRKVSKTGTYEFFYEYDELVVGENAGKSTTVVMLIHPIGVGIGRWFFTRLFEALSSKSVINRYVFLAPDLLGSASACHPTIRDTNAAQEDIATKKLPLFQIEDWSCQLLHLLQEYQSSNPAVDVSRVCLVANGGCAAIALDMAEKLSRPKQDESPELSTHVILSSPPRLRGLLRESPDPVKMKKTYNRILLGIPGKLFWWYSLRNDGAFIQKFSENNLAARPENLGPDWRSNCVETARSFDQRSRYGAFSFLAGALQCNCQEFLEELAARNRVRVDVIFPRDDRPNKAKSWVWQKRNANPAGSATTETSVSEYLQGKGLGGRQIEVGGRRCLAHEDAEGYASALLEFLK